MLISINGKNTQLLYINNITNTYGVVMQVKLPRIYDNNHLF